jgi:hypothetical protein
MMYATKDGSTWKISLIDNGSFTTANAGHHSSLVQDTLGQMFVAYPRGDDGPLMFAKSDGSGGWTTIKVDRGGKEDNQNGFYPSVALDTAGSPRISYYDKTNRDLKYASWGELHGT